MLHVYAGVGKYTLATKYEGILKEIGILIYQIKGVFRNSVGGGAGQNDFRYKTTIYFTRFAHILHLQ